MHLLYYLVYDFLDFPIILFLFLWIILLLLPEFFPLIRQLINLFQDFVLFKLTMTKVNRAQRRRLESLSHLVFLDFLG
jgi:hypothetical protein